MTATLHTPGHVYFIKAPGSDLIKIGFATDVTARLKALQAASPGELSLLGSVRGSRSDESRLHRLFADDRIRGEWFTDTPALRAIIAAEAFPWEDGEPPIVIQLRGERIDKYQMDGRRRTHFEALRTAILEGSSLYQLQTIFGTNENGILREIHELCRLGFLDPHVRELRALEREGRVQLKRAA